MKSKDKKINKNPLTYCIDIQVYMISGLQRKFHRSPVIYLNRIMKEKMEKTSRGSYMKKKNIVYKN